MRAKASSVVLLVFSLLISALGAQQTTPANIAVVVSDQMGARITHAQIRIKPSSDGFSLMETDALGQVAFNLQPGAYELSMNAPGFKQSTTRIDIQAMKEEQIFPVVLQVVATDGTSITSGDLKLFAPDHAPLSLSLSDLKALPHISVTYHNTHTNADETYSGVRVADLLAKMGAPLSSRLRGQALSDYVVATGSDGYAAVLALAEADPSFHPGEVIVADTMNGKPLDDHNGPFKLVVTEDKRPARSVRNLVSIELKTAE
jgi:hypothetical protein